jgi:hypothetical protein
VSGKINCYVKIVSIFLITATLIAGMVGCTEVPVVTLTITSTEGGEVITPGEGTFTYDEGTIVNLVAEAEESYLFVDWTGNVNTIANVNAAATTITVSGDYYITANFAFATEISDWYGMNATRNDLTGSYLLMNDLDSTTRGYQELAGTIADAGRGWQPIGNYTNLFAGIFDGQGYEIRDLFINRPDECDVGLFAHIGVRGCIRDIGIVNATVIGQERVSSLVGWNERGTLSNSYSTGGVYGSDCVGGLVGLNERGTVSNSYSTGGVYGFGSVGGLVGWNYDWDAVVSNSYSNGNVTGFYWVGGLVGKNLDGNVNHSYSTGTVTGETGGSGVGGLLGDNSGFVTDSYCTGCVIGNEVSGGLVGSNWWGSVSKSYSSGNVTGENYIGGLVGENHNAVVTSSYSTGSVIGQSYIGGLVGENDEGTVSNSYSTGNVTGVDDVGGLVGRNGGGVSHTGVNLGTVSNSYSTGSVTGVTYVGGLVGQNEEGTVSKSFWDTQTSGQATSDGGTGKTTTQMRNITTFSGAGWNIIAVALNQTNPDYIWNIVDDESYPFLS